MRVCSDTSQVESTTQVWRTLLESVAARSAGAEIVYYAVNGLIESIR